MSQAKKVNVAIAGATGAVGAELLKVLEDRNFPVAELRLLASARSVGKTLSFKGQDIKVQFVICEGDNWPATYAECYSKSTRHLSI